MERIGNVTEFILLGVTQNPELQKILLALFFITYLITMAGNLLISVTIFISPALGSPVYIFLLYLSIIDALYCSTIAPKMIFDLISQENTISYSGCMTHLFVGHFLAVTEICLLMVMAFDRYVAICKSLHYMTIMSWPYVIFLWGWPDFAVHSWKNPDFVHNPITILWPQCIDHFICDLILLLELVCMDTLGPLIAANSGSLCLLIFCMLVASYVVIFRSLRIHSSEGHRKAPSTCASHVTVVILFFVLCSFLYLRPLTAFSADKAVTMVFKLITPILNPLIYTLRNAKVKNVMKNLWDQIMKKGDEQILIRIFRKQF